jgi:hypothetical protein
MKRKASAIELCDDVQIQALRYLLANAKAMVEAQTRTIAALVKAGDVLYHGACHSADECQAWIAATAAAKGGGK